MDTPAGYMRQGTRAFEDGLPITANPYLFDAWPKRCFDLGWQYGEQCKVWSDGLHNNHKASVEVLTRVDKKPYDQGHVAFLQGRPMESPYEPRSLDDVDWRNGWLFAKLRVDALGTPGEPTLEEQIQEWRVEDETPMATWPLWARVLLWGTLAAIMWAIIMGVVFSPSARNSGYKACTTKEMNVWVDCPDSGPITGVRLGHEK